MPSHFMGCEKNIVAKPSSEAAEVKRRQSRRKFTFTLVVQFSADVFMSDQTAQLLKALEWRYATKVFDATRKNLRRCLARAGTVAGAHADFLRLAAVSFLVVQDTGNARRCCRIRGTKAGVDCSHFVVFTARTEMKKTDVDKLIARISSVRGVLAESMTPYWNMMIGDVVNGPRGKKRARMGRAAVFTLHWEI